MIEGANSQDPGEDRSARSVAAATRSTVELLVSLVLCLLMARTFWAEAYIVPTGSMAPTLLGWHREIGCAACGFRFLLGIDEEGRSGHAVCPNCGAEAATKTRGIESSGDRVLVQKFFYNFRKPRRWEVAVFQYPGDPSQAYVKRVVGLPGESVQIVDGDVFIDGRIARKSLEDQRGMRILVHDSRYEPPNDARRPRWCFRSGLGMGSTKTGWSREGGRFVHRAAPDAGADDWALYQHWGPARQAYGEIRDFYAYNGGVSPSGNIVLDLGLEADLTVERSVDVLLVALRSGADRFELRVPVRFRGPIELTHNGREVGLSNCWDPFHEPGAWPRVLTLEASAFDCRVQAAVNGRPLFDPYDYDQRRRTAVSGEIPIGLGAAGGGLTVDSLRIDRDVHYTSTLANTPRPARATRAPLALGPDEYFVLGDNSPVSNDSRFWDAGAVVPSALLLGKPFLVHLPGEVVPLRVFGRSVCWVPDPRRIRYIR